MKKDFIIKVCGMREGENIREVALLNPQWMGFIFYPKSPRYVSKKPDYLPQKAKRVGVFVNATEEFIQEKANIFQLDYLQLHGNESVEYCRKLYHKGFHLIKAFAFKTVEDIQQTEAYAPYCHYFVFDTPTVNYGGSGNRFDWSIIDYYKGKTPFLLSGGLSLSQIPKLAQMNHPQYIGIDLNSKFESKAGYKDPQKLQLFFENFKQQIRK
jgi:phosphoribosylanthranilate isomerase